MTGWDWVLMIGLWILAMTVAVAFLATSNRRGFPNGHGEKGDDEHDGER